MLSSLDATNSQGALLSLPLYDDSSGFRVVDVEGLAPVKATLVSSSFANLDGEQYHSSRREARNIKLKIELDPDISMNTVDDLRQHLYGWFMPESEVSLRFYKPNGFYADIVGRVESFDDNPFTQEPQVLVSIMCFLPDFYDPEPEVLEGFTTNSELQTQIIYPGSVSTGIKLVVSANRALPEFTVYHTPPTGDTRTFEYVQSPLISGDVLTINTNSGTKSALRNRSGIQSSVLYGISPQSNWIELQRGVNRIRVYAAGAPVPISLEYTARYGGM